MLDFIDEMVDNMMDEKELKPMPRTMGEAFYFVTRAQEKIWEDKISWPFQTRMKTQEILFKASLRICLEGSDSVSTAGE